MPSNAKTNWDISSTAIDSKSRLLKRALVFLLAMLCLYMFEKLFLSCCSWRWAGSHAKYGHWLECSYTIVGSVRNAVLLGKYETYPEKSAEKSMNVLACLIPFSVKLMLFHSQIFIVHIISVCSTFYLIYCLLFYIRQYCCFTCLFLLLHCLITIVWQAKTKVYGWLSCISVCGPSLSN